MNPWSQLKRITAPGLLPVSLAEVKQQCRVDHGDEDNILSSALASAVALLDGPDGTGFALMQQTWQLVLPQFPHELLLPLQPVTAIDSVQYIDVAGALQTFPSSFYRLCSVGHDASVELVSGAAWPATDMRREAVLVTFKCGAVAPQDVPASLRHAVLLMAGSLYENRAAENLSAGTNSVVLKTFDLLKNQYRRL